MVRSYARRKPKLGEIAEIAHGIRDKCVGDATPFAHCGETAVEISKVLQKRGIPHYMVSGHFVTDRKTLEDPDFDPAYDFPESSGHQWVQFDRKSPSPTILDVTADQFGDYPSVWYPADPGHYFPEAIWRGGRDYDEDIEADFQ